MVVVYMGHVNNFQVPVQNIIAQLAWLYRLDYSIVDGDEVFPLVGEPCDMIYFRSTEYTSITPKQFRQLVGDMFSQASLGGWVDVSFQLQKALKDYPFPADFIRPLNYPYPEIHQDGTAVLYIDPKALKNLKTSPDLTVN